jgi:methylated-DNA-[protein]-cysteine S-methyltransferase
MRRIESATTTTTIGFIQTVMTRSDIRFALFDTTLGTCGIAWGERGIASTRLPEPSQAQARARLLRQFSGAQEAAPTTEVADAIDGIVALLDGRQSDLTFVSLDMDDVPAFDRRVYEIARTIPAGSVLTYGEIATRLGAPREARAVGQALGHNPFAIVVPCHRVVAAGGKLGGFSAPGGVRTKQRLLAIEGAPHQLGMELTPVDRR